MQEIDLSTLAIASPTVIYLTGFMTTDSRPSYVAANLKSLKNIMRDKSGNTPAAEIYVWSYSNLRNVFNLAAYNCRPEHACSATAVKLAAGVIMPLVSENGQPLPRAEAQKRLRNVTFFGYSAGTILAQEVFNASMKMMQKIGYKPEEVRELLREVVLVSAGNVSRPAKEKNRFTTLYLAGSDDGMTIWTDRIWSPRQNLFARLPRQMTIKQMSDTSLLITAPAKKEKNIHYTLRNLFARLTRRPTIKPPSDVSPHALLHYTTSDDTHGQFSKIALNALINAVNRKTTPDVFQLLEPLPSHPPQETAIYRDRIKKAIGGN